MLLDELNKRRPNSSVSSTISTSTTITTDAPREESSRRGGNGVARAADAGSHGGGRAAPAAANVIAAEGKKHEGSEMAAEKPHGGPVNKAVSAATVPEASVGPGDDAGTTPVVSTGGDGGSAEGARDEGWRMDRELESDLLKLFGQADQVDAAFKVKGGQDVAGMGWGDFCGLFWARDSERSRSSKAVGGGGGRSRNRS